MKREFLRLDTEPRGVGPGETLPGILADVGRWTFLEKGIDSVMLKLEEGVDMKTVWRPISLSPIGIGIPFGRYNADIWLRRSSTWPCTRMFISRGAWSPPRIG